MEKIIKLSIFLILVFISLVNNAQRVIIVAHQPVLKIHNGFVVIKCVDTITGKIKLCQHSRGLSGITIEVNNNTIFIAEKDIDYLKVSDYDSTVVTTNYTEYERITNKPELWRHIASGKINIYDNVPYANEVAGDICDKILIVDEGNIENISHTFSMFTTSDLFTYINRKYHARYRAKDFDTVKNLLIFISNS
jgi:hypothetical protein